MLEIGICDDEIIVLKKLKNIILEGLKQLKIEARICLFQNGLDLLKRKETLDILFLDVVMPGLNGFEIGERMRKRGSDCKIIMETRCDHRYKEAFCINAFRFVTKPIEKQEVQKALKEAIHALGVGERIEVYKERIKYNIYERDIFYIEAINSSVEFILKEGVFRKESSLENMEKALNKERFYRISRQCIVNITKIDKYEKGIITINHKEKRVSQRRKKMFDMKYREYKACHA